MVSCYTLAMDKIDELLTRGVDTIYPDKAELEKVLRSGKKLKLYQGFDPTGTQLHIGHLIGLRKLKQWQELGHHVIFLIGDFTAMIGDPSGKLTSRKMLTREEVLKNAEFYKEQAGKILNFHGENPVEIKFNSDWLGKISAIEFIKISGLLSVQQVVERDMFQERQKRGEDIYMNEFMYPVMQAYDSVAMNVDLEIGGTDQMFNMLMGRKLMRHMLKKDKFVITTPLLTDSEGRKIGKTEGNVIALTDEPKDLYKKIMALPDDIIIKGLEYLTDTPMNEIKAISNNDPMTNKKRLAFEIVKQLNGEEQAIPSQEYFESTVQKKELPSDIQPFYISRTPSSGATIITELVASQLAETNSEAKRLVQQGGVTYDNKIVQNPNEPFIPKENAILRVGKNTEKIRKIKFQK